MIEATVATAMNGEPISKVKTIILIESFKLKINV
tara:strand:- start:390 stop:491 length:102 start_codon:yes stop_codon:yes gene_type:complete